MAVRFAAQLLPVSGNEQQRVVGPRPEDENRHDRRGLSVDGHADLPEQVADRAAGELREADGQDRDDPEDRAAVDDDQQEEDQRPGHCDQRPVDVPEDLDRIGRVAGRPRHLHLQASAVAAADDRADRIHRVEDRLRLAVRCDVRAEQRRRPVGCDHRCGERRGARELLRVELGAIARDLRAVGWREAGAAPVDGHDRHRLLAGERSGCLKGLRRLGRCGQERCRVVLLDLVELLRKIGGPERDHRDQPDGEGHPLRTRAGADGQELLHGRRGSSSRRASEGIRLGAVSGPAARAARRLRSPAPGR
ncbi:unannotated protein [freshwater metagenome]|uniref:Unannotated protein n=1 Tax=freshwater metagenome TaxID=449393 RepID=A0A6J7D2Y6_9ZZZZ